MNYYICVPFDSERKPFLAMLDAQANERFQLAKGAAALRGSDVAHDKAVRHAFGESCSYATLTYAEYWQALRDISGPDSGTDGGQHAPIDPIKPKPTKPRGGIAARMAMAGTA